MMSPKESSKMTQYDRLYGKEDLEQEISQSRLLSVGLADQLIA